MSKNKGGRPREYQPEQIAEALRKAGGIYTQAARMLDCDRRTVVHYIERYDWLKEVQTETREKKIDLAETVVMRHLQENNLTAAFFVLNTQGKTRGYSTKHEVSGTINVIVEELSDEDLMSIARSSVKSAETTSH